jgi:hypothetical protein
MYRGIPSLTILWLGLPLMLLEKISFVLHDRFEVAETYHAKPTPQASFSKSGSYKPL